MNCPYINCTHTFNNELSQSIIVCDQCHGMIIKCTECGYINQLWAIYCRACGKIISHKKIGIDQYHPVIKPNLDNNASLGRFVKYRLGPHDRIQHYVMQAINASILIFCGDHPEKYTDVMLLHPYLQTSGTNIMTTSDLFKEDRPLLTGAALMSDRFLFIGAQNNLFRINLPAISTANPFRMDKNIEQYDIGCNQLFHLSEPFIMIENKIDNSRLRFDIWNVQKNQSIANTEENGYCSTLINNMLIIISNHQLNFYRVDDDFSHKTTIDLEDCQPISMPFIIERNLFLLTKDNKDNKMLLKWEINEHGYPMNTNYEVVIKESELYAINKVNNNYMLVYFFSIVTYNPVYDNEMKRFNFERGIHTSVDPSIFSSLAAIPFVNDHKSSSISVVDTNTQNYLYTTENYLKILCSPLLWGRFLYVIAQKKDNEPVELFGYDLQCGDNECTK